MERNSINLFSFEMRGNWKCMDTFILYRKLWTHLYSTENYGNIYTVQKIMETFIQYRKCSWANVNQILSSNSKLENQIFKTIWRTCNLSATTTVVWIGEFMVTLQYIILFIFLVSIFSYQLSSRSRDFA